MHDAQLVAVNDSVEKRDHDFATLSLREGLLLHNLLKQLTRQTIKKRELTYLTACQNFHYDVDVLVVFLNIVQFNDVWVVDLLHNVDFIL